MGGVNAVIGSTFNDLIIGNSDSNSLIGLDGADRLDGGAGNDALTGGTGSDIFVYGYGSGFDRIADFDRGSGAFDHNEGDRIDLSAFAGISGIDDLGLISGTQGATFVPGAGGPDTRITNSAFGSGAITLIGVTSDSVVAEDFIFFGQTLTPTINGDLGLSAVKGGFVVLTTTDFHAEDAGVPAEELIFTVVNPTHGWVAWANAPETPIAAFTEADLEAGSVIFVHDGSDVTQATFKISVTDGLSAPTGVTTINVAVPTVAIAVKTPDGMNFENDNTITAIGAGEVQPDGTSPSTKFTIVNTDANRQFVFEGTGFTYGASNALIGGTIFAFHKSILDTQLLLADFDGRIDAATFHAGAVAQSQGDPSLFDALSSQWTMTFTGSDGDDAFGSDDQNDFFKASGGNDTFNGGFGIDRANYTAWDGPIEVQLADGIVTKRDPLNSIIGTDTLRSIEHVTGTNYIDIFDATGFSFASTNAGSTLLANTDGTSNEFEGRGGDDDITGNGSTRVSYLHATSGVVVNFTSWVTGQGATGTADGDVSVGHDTFTGVNKVRGSNFSDTLLGSNNDSGTTEYFEGRGGDDFIDGRGGFDRAVYLFDDSGDGTGIVVNLAAGTVFGGVNTGHDTLRSIESITGTDFSDSYDATGFTDASTNAGSAGVNGSGAAFNEFEGAGGDDTITGNGNTRIAFYNATAGVTVNLTTGTSFGSAPGDVAGVGTDTFTGVNRVRGSEFNDTILGDSSNNILEGRGGNDVLKGLSADSGISGNDTMTGGTGSDIFVVTSGGGGGNDIITDFSRSEGDLIDLRALNVNGFGQNGSGLSGMITQDGADALITFGVGNTLRLTGIIKDNLGGRDFLFHGAVSITVQTPNGFNLGTLYDDIAGADPNQPGNTDTHFTAVNSAAGLTFSVTSVADSTFTYDASGSPTGGFIYSIDIYDTENNILVSTNGWEFDAGDLSTAISDYLAPGNSTAGLDAIFITGLNADLDPRYGAVGSVGPDTFISSVAGVRTEHFNGLTGANGDLFDGDTVDYSHTPGPSGVTVDLNILGEQDTIGAGTDALFNIENLRGSAFNDTLTGDAHNNVFEGGPGDDTLDGGGGNNTASYEHAPDGGGGLGVTVNLGTVGAQNTVTAGIDTLTNIQNLRGSAFDDTLIGDGNNNVLEGGPGQDSLDGSGGSDTASYVHAAAGVTVNLANPNQNTGEAFGDSYVSIENLFGSRFNDHLTGDASANRIDGGYGGDDVLTGLAGADTFVFHGGDLTVTDFNHGEGDLIDVSGLGLTDTQVQALIDASSPGDTIDFGDGNALTLTGVDVHALITAAGNPSKDFIYA